MALLNAAVLSVAFPDPDAFEGMKPCRSLPKPKDKPEREWSCTTLPGAYQSVCNQKQEISLESLLTPVRTVQPWKPPTNLTELYQDLALRILKPYDTITTKMLDELERETSCEEPLRFKLNQGRVWVTSPLNISWVDPVKRVFTTLRRMHPLKNLNYMFKHNILDNEIYLEGVICIGDAPPKGPAISLVWNTQWQSGEPSGIPMPFMEYSTPLDTWDKHLKEVFQWRDKFNWNRRHEIAIFRGGKRSCYPKKYGDELARKIEYPEGTEPPSCGRLGLMDVAEQCGGADVALEKRRMEMKQQEAYKYILHAEGHDGWANRLSTLLAMQNVIIRQFNAPYEEWYSAFLQPWVHYIPVDHLFNYLPSIVKWCMMHDGDVQQISKNADLYAKTFLPARQQLEMTRTILEEYSKRFRKSSSIEDERNWLPIDELADLITSLMTPKKGKIEVEWNDTGIFEPSVVF
eukprot:CAMPEP_0202442158 /NCGR_PEP_ID=MMETSP1360-20130828/1619_1 /ASSEMBLY_ACC=CAM_ASM_000848 /TAXON_ID=515479 /ORGANISM="Licmophora paradoxa, Strain CCMP2313" /LENGTH=459 /DNA_ID=CAMNT_0049057431 /DNA_START=166 /DNA_END=1546 /DNA_ORIENTATION=+